MGKQLPPDFIIQTVDFLGISEAQALCMALSNTSPPVSLRLHPIKGKDLPEMAFSPVPWAMYGRYLEERPSFTADPRFHAGCYYVQEASSMFIERAFHTMQIHPKSVLDLCAAPGGKSTHWRSLLTDDCLLIANEPIPQRANVLVENLAKWGHPSTIVTQTYPETFGAFPNLFDIIATDVPCSGEGMFRKDENAVNEWSRINVKFCANRQRNIITDVWPALRTGGFLVYSTCTFNPEECDHNVRFICEELGAEVVPIPTEDNWGTITSSFGTHFYPHRTKGEGFFLALLKKTAKTNSFQPSEHHAKGKKLKITKAPINEEWLIEQDKFTFFSPYENTLVAFPKEHLDTLEQLAQAVHILQAGIPFATKKGKKFVPQPELALSLALHPQAFPSINLSYEIAQRYLQREALILPNDTPRGFILAGYEGKPLGFLNNLGSRANNLYHPEWRIRKRL